MRSLLTAAAISLAFTLFLTPVFLRLFRKWGWGQVIRTPENVHNPSHGEKRGTPTMGGTIFIVGTIVGYLVGCYTGNNPPTISGWLVIWMMVGFGAVGFIDDYMKVRRQRSLGLSGWRKIVGQILVVVPFAVGGAEFPERVGSDARHPRTSRSSVMCRWLWLLALGPIIGWLLYMAWISFIGVACPTATTSPTASTGSPRARDLRRRRLQPHRVLAVQPSCAGGGNLGRRTAGVLPTPRSLRPRDRLRRVRRRARRVPLVECTQGQCVHGRCRVDGDRRRHRRDGDPHAHRTALVLIAGVFIIGPGSVILQRMYFKVTRGKRLFLMSPFHHHLEMRGWSEITIVVRMWIIAGLLAVSGIGFFYVEWLSQT